MTLQDRVNQTQYAARKATLGIVLGFSLAGASKVAYAAGETITINEVNTLTLNSQSANDIDNQSAIPIDPPDDSTKVDITQQYGNPSPTLLPIIKSLPPINHLVLLTPAQRRQLAEEERRRERADEAAELAKRLESTEESDFPSLSSLKEHYHDFEQRNGSIHYKAKALSGYYVHYPQSHRIYYVDKENNKSGRGRTTVAYSIADEQGTILYRANEKGEMVHVENKAEVASPTQNTLESRVEQKQQIIQPTAADISVFQNMFDCSSQVGLYSATGVGVGSLAAISSFAALLHIRRRRKLNST